MSTVTIITCDCCKKEVELGEGGICRRYYGGARSVKSRERGERFLDRTELEYDLCDGCAKLVTDAIFNVFRGIGGGARE
jgi:hypothetical protein